MSLDDFSLNLFWLFALSLFRTFEHSSLKLLAIYAVEIFLVASSIPDIMSNSGNLSFAIL